jgi:uncharacterized alpha-E superfamily protein
MTILDDAAAALMTLAGFALDGMTRDLGWRFMSIGRRLERLQFQSVVLQRALAMDENGNLDWLLELSDSIITYRARYRAQPEWLPVLDLLLRDETNPRSILFQINGILGALNKIAKTHGACGEDLLAPLKGRIDRAAAGLGPELRQCQAQRAAEPHPAAPARRCPSRSACSFSAIPTRASKGTAP